jgi:hypothetical protein
MDKPEQTRESSVSVALPYKDGIRRRVTVVTRGEKKIVFEAGPKDDLMEVIITEEAELPVVRDGLFGFGGMARKEASTEKV